MTEYLNECLSYLQKNWKDREFDYLDVYPEIRRGRYNLDRLEALGYLTSRLARYPNRPSILVKYYRLT